MTLDLCRARVYVATFALPFWISVLSTSNPLRLKHFSEISNLLPKCNPQPQGHSKTKCYYKRDNPPLCLQEGERVLKAVPDSTAFSVCLQ